MVNSFERRPLYLLAYVAPRALVVALAVAALLQWQEIGNWWLAALTLALLLCMRFDALLLALVPAALMADDPLAAVALGVVLLPLTWAAGIVSTVFIHNASHGQFRPRWLNPVLGECAAFVLHSNYLGWAMVHYYHHKHTDDPELDPHAPRDLAFWPYANGMLPRVVTYLDARHKELHNLPAWLNLATLVAGLLFLALSPLLWLLMLGPTWFFALWLPVVITGQWLITVINYQNHAADQPGPNHPIDLDRKLWHRLVNRIGFGVLYHEVHHRDATRFDPSSRTQGAAG